MTEIELLQSTKLKLSAIEPNKGQIEGLPKNPRFIKDEKFKKLVKSIEEHPEMTAMRELLVYPLENGKYIIIGGNMRYRAMKEIGIKEAPCKVIPQDTSIEQLQAYTLKDNSGYGEWDFDLLANKVMVAYGVKKGAERVKRYYQKNNDALKAFQQRRDRGMNLSQKLWNQSEVYKRGLETALSTAIEKGMSAVKLSKRVSQYLNNYDSLKRDYKAKYGKATDIHDCEYASIRLARSEINMAYRSAEQLRWQQMDFIIGYEVKLSDNHNCKGVPTGAFVDICDDLKGKYPKDFKWLGWHPNCRCYVIPIIKSEEQFWLDDNERGNDNEEITNVPQGFKDWVSKNQDRIARAEQRGTLPYFVRDNRERVKETIKYQTTSNINESFTERRKKIKHEANKWVDKGLTAPNFPHKITISKKGIKEWLNQPHKHYESKNELLLKIDEVLSSSKYKGTLPDINNGSISAHLFETTINGDLSWIIVRLTPEGIARLYSVTDSDKMIRLIKK